MAVVLPGGPVVGVRWLGRFREFSGVDEDPLMSESVDVLSTNEAFVIARYLRAGLDLIDVMEIKPDVLDGSQVAETASVLGDGEWMWREDLAHYVEKYRVGLDLEFLPSIVRWPEPVSETAMLTIVAEAVRLWQGNP